jgi:hypothetical protein
VLVFVEEAFVETWSSAPDVQLILINKDAFVLILLEF